MEFNGEALLIDFCIMALLMLIAQLIRGKVSFFQKTYIPASVIAGFIGLIMGPQFLNIIKWSTQSGSYAWLLVVIVYAGLFIGKKEKINLKKIISQTGDSFCVNMGAELLGFGTSCFLGALILKVLFKDGLFEEIALLQPAGFIGGHGYAAAIGGALNQLMGRNDCIYIGQTFATIGLLIGIFVGLIIINFAVRKKVTSCVTTIDQLPESARTGKLAKDEKEPMGYDTIHPMTMDPLAFHLILILTATGMGYGTYYLYKSIPAFEKIEIPVTCMAMIFGVLIHVFMNKIGYGSQIDRKVINRIGGTATDFLVAFGVATIKISIVIEYWLPIVILSVIGLILAIFTVFFIGRKMFHNYWFERSIFIFGWMTGVVAIGIALLRVVDPEMKSQTLEEYGIISPLLSFIEVFLIMFLPVLVVTMGTIITGGLLLIFAIALLWLSKVKFGWNTRRWKDITQ